MLCINYFWKMRGYPQFSFLISITLVKIYISPIIINRGKKPGRLEALLGVPMSSVWISQLAMSQFRNILVSPVGISLINFSSLPLWQSPFAGTTPTEHTASIVSTFKLRVLRPFLMFNTYSDYFPTYPIEQFGNRTQSNTNRSIAELNRT